MRIDIKKTLKECYRAPRTKFVEIHVPEMRYLAVDGAGDPNTSEAYKLAVQSLYSVGYAVRASFKERTGDDFVVGPLEGLWFSDDPTTFVTRDKDQWQWTMLIPLPEQVIDEDVQSGRDAAALKKPELPISQVEFRTINEGRSLQRLHVGPYEDEGPALAELHSELMPSLGVTFNGPHHEIYLGDPRRAAPEKLRTILRQPIRPVEVQA